MARRYYAVTPTYTPLTYDEVTKPLIEMATQMRAEQKDLGEQAVTAASVGQLINPAVDTDSYKAYQDYMDALVAARDSLYATGDITKGSRDMYALKQQYATQVKPIETAYKARSDAKEAQDKFNQTKKSSGIFEYDPNEFDLDSLVRYPGLLSSGHMVAGSDLYDRANDFASNFRKVIGSASLAGEEVNPYVTGLINDVIGGTVSPEYYYFLTQDGLTPEEYNVIVSNLYSWLNNGGQFNPAVDANGKIITDENGNPYPDANIYTLMGVRMLADSGILNWSGVRDRDTGVVNPDDSRVQAAIDYIAQGLSGAIGEASRFHVSNKGNSAYWNAWTRSVSGGSDGSGGSDTTNKPKYIAAIPIFNPLTNNSVSISDEDNNILGILDQMNKPLNQADEQWKQITDWLTKNGFDWKEKQSLGANSLNQLDQNLLKGYANQYKLSKTNGMALFKFNATNGSGGNDMKMTFADNLLDPIRIADSKITPLLSVSDDTKEFSSNLETFYNNITSLNSETNGESIVNYTQKKNKVYTDYITVSGIEFKPGKDTENENNIANIFDNKGRIDNKSYKDSIDNIKKYGYGLACLFGYSNQKLQDIYYAPPMLTSDSKLGDDYGKFILDYSIVGADGKIYQPRVEIDASLLYDYKFMNIILAKIKDDLENENYATELEDVNNMFDSLSVQSAKLQVPGVTTGISIRNGVLGTGLGQLYDLFDVDNENQ